jgi:hypothetical protein
MWQESKYETGYELVKYEFLLLSFMGNQKKFDFVMSDPVLSQNRSLNVGQNRETPFEFHVALLAFWTLSISFVRKTVKLFGNLIIFHYVTGR